MTMQTLPPAIDLRECPLQDVIGRIADKWKLLILMELARSPVLRFKELQRALGTVSQKVLTSALRDLEHDGLVERRSFAEVPPRVEYRATEAVYELLPILDQLRTWAQAHLERLERAGRAVDAASPFSRERVTAYQKR